MGLTKKQQEIIHEIHDFVKNESKKKILIDNVFEKHILNVVNFSKKLSKKYNANSFVVILAAYLHDIYHIQTRNHKIHEIEGSKFVKKYLKDFYISEEDINLVSLCILNHRGSKNSKKESVEERIVASADAMDHIDRSTEMFFRLIKKGMAYEDALFWIRKKLKRSWEKIELEEARKIIKPKFEAAKVLFEIPDEK